MPHSGRIGVHYLYGRHHDRGIPPLAGRRAAALRREPRHARPYGVIMIKTEEQKVDTFSVLRDGALRPPAGDLQGRA